MGTKEVSSPGNLHRVPWLHNKWAAVGLNPATAADFWVETKGKKGAFLHTILVALPPRPAQRDASAAPNTNGTPLRQVKIAQHGGWEGGEERTEDAAWPPQSRGTMSRRDVPS